MMASFAKTITEADIVLFAATSGDNNAMHINEEFASATQTVTAIKLEARRVKLSTICTVRGQVVIEGEATVMTTSSKPAAERAPLNNVDAVLSLAPA